MEIQEGGNQKKKTTTENKIKTPRRGCVKSETFSVRCVLVLIVYIRHEGKRTQTLKA